MSESKLRTTSMDFAVRILNLVKALKEAIKVPVEIHTHATSGLGAMTLPIVCKEWCQEVGWDSEDWWNDPVGSGPYYVDEFVTGSHVTFKLKDNYWGDFTSPYKTVVVTPRVLMSGQSVMKHCASSGLSALRKRLPRVERTSNFPVEVS